MKTLVHIRCGVCRWYSSRTPRADQNYGHCPRCLATLAEVRARKLFHRAAPPKDRREP